MAKGKRLKKDLEDHRKVGIDTDVFLHHFEGGQLAEVTTVLLERVQDGHCAGVVCSLSVAEAIARPLELGMEGLADRYRILFHEMPNLEVAPVDEEVAAEAASISAQHGLGIVEGCVLAAVGSAGATALFTNNNRLRVVKSLRVMVLDDYL